MIKLIIGPMMSKKTTALVEKYNNSNKDTTLFLSHALNNRSYLTHCRTNHNIEVFYLKTSTELNDVLKNNVGVVDRILIDEIQFFDETTYRIIEKYSLDFDFYIAGLNKDYKGNPFKTTGNIAMVADDIYNFKGSCSVCEEPSIYSYRLSKTHSLIEVGGEESYIPLCRRCYKEKIKALV